MPVTVFCVESNPPRLHATESQIPLTLVPVSKCELEYLNEGGANFVFKILPVSGQELPTCLERRLLRLRKNRPHVQRAEDQLSSLESNFRDLFPAENLIQHELIYLQPGVSTLLNAMLQTLVRPGHRSGDFLSTEDTSGLLVTDMTPEPGEVLLQLKPKWLTQSPNAPPNAQRCRTCAMRAQRRSESLRTATDAQTNCPLDLVNADLEERKRAVHALTTDRRIREYLLTPAQPLLQQLRACQMGFDGVGILETTGTVQIQSLCKAMTLRDCTLFVRRSGKGVEARLGDLDLKQPEKLTRWKTVERRLIDAGWYTNSEFEHVWTKEKVCLLSHCD